MKPENAELKWDEQCVTSVIMELVVFPAVYCLCRTRSVEAALTSSPAPGKLAQSAATA